jgi:hypothetical chaperone protein
MRLTDIIGIDFGTTNSVVSVLQENGATAPGAATFRTLLCFWTEESPGKNVLHHAAGPAAIEAYLDDPLDHRLIMSMKTYLAQRSFTQTRIYGRIFTLEQLIADFLGELLAASGIDPATSLVVAGRPVRFAGESADDDFGEARLRAAFTQAGFARLQVALEPHAAGFRFARSLDREAVVLVGDFGGGTSDFSVIRFRPSAAEVVPLGHAGVGIAGDTFDFRIIDRVISPLLGKGDSYTVMGKKLPVPAEYFASFARWHRLSLMRTPRTLREIEEVARTSAHPPRLRNLIRLIDDELGYQLYQTVSQAKAALSTAHEARLHFAHRDFLVDQVISRAAFETWIADDLARMSAAIDRALDDAGRPQIDRVFLTGGTSFVPAVRRLFEQRFGAELVSGGGEFVSVAEGLALMGAGFRMPG